ncbi:MULTISPECIES: zinc-ribbon domain-containing protein [Megasphaera]|uniref:Zinc-ribbon domain protein n=1 Tax=Megasphaera vaginalis (ex Srinivasan et al. 2021) TaxID=1111454 RepID=U7USP5_9FIRM|nr:MULTISPECIES: zinc ribbon domain-containing protein [Megasphaera]ERT62301.1 zinc-ribbon domain protein [Megasphaera vaginalis (ex Srinivasan et al. 2021)]
MKCPRCGKPVPPGAKTCPYCGAPLPPPGSRKEEEMPSVSAKTTGIGVAVVIVVVLAAVAAFVLLR